MPYYAVVDKNNKLIHFTEEASDAVQKFLETDNATLRKVETVEELVQYNTKAEPSNSIFDKILSDDTLNTVEEIVIDLKKIGRKVLADFIRDGKDKK